MTKAAAYNFEVDDITANDFGAHYVPKHLLCQTHLCLKFIKKYPKFFLTLKQALNRIKFTKASSNYGTVFQQLIDSLTGRVSLDFDHKSWNCSKDFSLFISSRKSLTSRLKKERINRFVYPCAVVAYFGGDVTGMHCSTFLLD